MTQLSKAIIYKAFSTLSMLAFLQVMAFAQQSSESNGASTIIGHYTWYTQPWAWITGIALVLIIIVALVPTSSSRNNRATPGVNYFKTTKPDVTNKSYS